jgi:hypothetical protein
VANPPQQVNYFLNTLGELVQRMSDPTASPTISNIGGLVNRLPPLARRRLRMTIYFVKRAAATFVSRPLSPEAKVRRRDREPRIAQRLGGVGPAHPAR